MMAVEIRELDVTLEVRETSDNPDVAATIDGIAVPYDTPTMVGPGVREQFAPGAFDVNDVIGKPLLWRHKDPIGVITRAANEPGGLRITADIANTALGRDTAALLRTGSVKGLSVGFEPTSNGRTGNLITRMKAVFHELTVTHIPAYATAGVSEVREEPNPEENPVDESTAPAVVEATVPETREQQFATVDQVTRLERQIASVSTVQVTDRPVDPEAWLREYGIKRFQKRALDDLILDATDTDIAVVPTEVSARVAFGRPTVNAIGTAALGATGNDAVWLVQTTPPGVAKRSTAEKTAVNSVNPVVTKVSAPVETFAGALDVSLEWIARSAAYDYPYLIGQMAEQYARKVNLDVAAKITAAAANTIILPDTGLTAEVLGAKLAFAASKIAVGTGRPPSLIVLSAEKFFQVATVAGFGFPVAGGASVGNANLAGMTYTAFGVRFVCDPTLDGNLGATQHGYVLDPMSIGIKENAGAPLTIEANNVELLGRDVALYGFVASAVLNAAGIVSVVDA